LKPLAQPAEPFREKAALPPCRPTPVKAAIERKILMDKSNNSKLPPSPAKPAKKGVSNEKPRTLVEEKAHVFEHRHWVSEACGDDLWET
jgi:hypothetical protein